MKLGYLQLDGAEVYKTEREQGKAIAESGIPREKLFITSKVLNSQSDIPKQLEQSLKNLGVTYLDLYLIHQPWDAKGDKQKLQAAWAQMEQLQASGKVKSIGVSNFYREHLDAILETAKARPAVNQLEFHPYLQHGDLLAYHKNKDIRVQAYGPLTPVTKARPGPLDPLLAQLAKKYGVGEGEILLKWATQQGIITITTSAKEQRLSDMLRIFTFELTPNELNEIARIGNEKHHRGFWTHVGTSLLRIILLGTPCLDLTNAVISRSLTKTTDHDGRLIHPPEFTISPPKHVWERTPR